MSISEVRTDYGVGPLCLSTRGAIYSTIEEYYDLGNDKKC